MSETNKGPAFKSQFGRVRASIFSHESSDQSQGATWFTYSFTRCYPKGENDFGYTSSFAYKDLDDLAKALAWTREILEREKSAASRKEGK
jgi:hypothetical protein